MSVMYTTLTPLLFPPEEMTPLVRVKILNHDIKPQSNQQPFIFVLVLYALIELIDWAQVMALVCPVGFDDHWCYTNPVCAYLYLFESLEVMWQHWSVADP